MIWTPGIATPSTPGIGARADPVALAVARTG